MKCFKCQEDIEIQNGEQPVVRNVNGKDRCYHYACDNALTKEFKDLEVRANVARTVH